MSAVKIQQNRKLVEQNNDLISSHNHLVILEILNNMNCKKVWFYCCSRNPDCIFLFYVF